METVHGAPIVVEQVFDLNATVVGILNGNRRGVAARVIAGTSGSGLCGHWKNVSAQ